MQIVLMGRSDHAHQEMARQTTFQTFNSLCLAGKKSAAEENGRQTELACPLLIAVIPAEIEPPSTLGLLSWLY